MSIAHRVRSYTHGTGATQRLASLVALRGLSAAGMLHVDDPGHWMDRWCQCLKP